MSQVDTSMSNVINHQSLSNVFTNNDDKNGTTIELAKKKKRKPPTSLRGSSDTSSEHAGAVGMTVTVSASEASRREGELKHQSRSRADVFAGLEDSDDISHLTRRSRRLDTVQETPDGQDRIVTIDTAGEDKDDSAHVRFADLDDDGFNEFIAIQRMARLSGFVLASDRKSITIGISPDSPRANAMNAAE